MALTGEDRDYFTEYAPVTPPKLEPRQVGFINRMTAMLQAYRGNVDMPEDLVVPSDREMLSRTGMRRVERNAVVEFWGISPNYYEAVRDCKKLTETNPIFSAIIRSLTRTIAEVPTTVDFEESTGARGRAAGEIVRNMLSRVMWNDNKEQYLRAMLCEGGLSLEVVVSNKRTGIDRLEYRPHETIRPNVSPQGAFTDPAFAYEQIDVVRRQLAKFALWQIIDVNLEESFYHDRGIPHLQAARQLLEYSGVMIRGLMQKWIREGGSIEHFNLEDAQKWEDVDHFQDANQDTLNAAPDNLIRQFFTKGKVKIERLTADARAHSTSPLEFVMELIFLAAGVSKELLGFKSHVVIRDMIDLQINNYFQHLNRIQTRLFAALRKAVDFELLLHGMLPEELPYRVLGGRFEVTRQVRVDKLAVDTGAVSVNDIRRASNLPPLTHPVWDIPGFWNDPATARKLARMYGVSPVADPASLEVRTTRKEPPEAAFLEEEPTSKKKPKKPQPALPEEDRSADPLGPLVDAVGPGGIFHCGSEKFGTTARLVDIVQQGPARGRG